MPRCLESAVLVAALCVVACVDDDCERTATCPSDEAPPIATDDDAEDARGGGGNQRSIDSGPSTCMRNLATRYQRETRCGFRALVRGRNRLLRKRRGGRTFGVECLFGRSSGLGAW